MQRNSFSNQKLPFTYFEHQTRGWQIKERFGADKVFCGMKFSFRGKLGLNLVPLNMKTVIPEALASLQTPEERF